MSGLRVVHITPGAAGMFCGGCVRDNALVAALRRQGVSVLMTPLYTPLHVDESDQSVGTPIFFGGISVYLEQKYAWFRTLPRWMRRWLDTPALLRAVSSFATKTQPSELGDLTVSMLKGSDGFQASELDPLVEWLRTQERPDVICLSNILLGGLAGRLRRDLGVPVVSYLQGEDYFLDGLPTGQRDEAWRLASGCAKQLDMLIAPSRFYAWTMARRLGLGEERVRVVYNGIHPEGYEPGLDETRPPTLGYFARLCPEKGLGLAVDTFLELRKQPRFGALRFHAGGSCTGGDVAYVASLRSRLEEVGAGALVRFETNVDRTTKIRLLQGMNVFCTPATYGEAFGLYVLEALACGTPVVAPRVAAFPELAERIPGIMLADPTPGALAEAIAPLLEEPTRARELGRLGRERVLRDFSMERMARETAELYRSLGRTPGGAVR